MIKIKIIFLDFNFKDTISYGDGKRITFNNLQNTEESHKIEKLNKGNKTNNNNLFSKMNNSPLNRKNNKDLNRSISPSNCSISVSNSNTKNNRNTKSIVKKQINHTSKVLDDLYSTKYLNDYMLEKHSKDKNQVIRRKSMDRKKEENILNEINNNFNNKFSNNKTKAKIVNGRNIAMMKQKPNNNNNNQNLKNNLSKINAKIPSLNFNSNNNLNKNINEIKSKTPQMEKEIIFDIKSISEKTTNEIIENRDNTVKYDNNTFNNTIYSPIYSNDKNNLYSFQNLNNNIIDNNASISNNISNINVSYDNPNKPIIYSNNNYNSNNYQTNNPNNNIIYNNIPNLFSSNNNTTTNNPVFDNNTNNLHNYNLAKKI